jgi:hypothetical protein
VDAGCWHALPMGIHATLMLAPGCSPWRPKSGSATSPDTVTDGGGGEDMRRASTMQYVRPSETFIEDAYRQAVSAALGELAGEE